MTDTSQYRTDDEVTVTIRGRVAHPDTGGGLVVEFLNCNGFPDRLVVRPSVEVTVEAGELTDEAKERRIAAHRMLHRAGLFDEDRAAVQAQVPYGVDLAATG